MFLKLGRLKFKVKELRIASVEKKNDDRKKILKRRELVWKKKQEAKKEEQVLLIDSSSNNREVQSPAYFRLAEENNSVEVIAGERNFVAIK